MILDLVFYDQSMIGCGYLTEELKTRLNLNAESPGGEPIQVSEAANPQLKQNS